MDEILKDERLGERDEELLRQFFSGHSFQVADNGFTHRVGRLLPDRSLRLNRLWTAVCATAVVVFLIVTKSWVIVAGALQGFLADAVTHLSQTNVLSAFATVVLLTAFASYGIVANSD